jgi:formyltetrahydrofolate hydrolase
MAEIKKDSRIVEIFTHKRSIIDGIGWDEDEVKFDFGRRTVVINHKTPQETVEMFVVPFENISLWVYR